ncbi:MAG: N-6 DNA methylase [Caldilineales bacterium]
MRLGRYVCTVGPFYRQRPGALFYGQERIETTWRLGRMNLILHGLDGKIAIGNSLLGDQHPSLKADVVIANPPFNQRTWGADKVDPRMPACRWDTAGRS